MNIKNVLRLRAFLLEWGTHSVLLPIIRRFIAPPLFPYTVNQLREMPSGTVGQQMAMFLTSNNFSLLSGYETHDVKHVLLDYAPNEAGEAAMQYFFLGNRDYSLPVIITIAITLLIMPEHYGLFVKAFRRGRQTPRLAGTHWSSLVPKNKQTILSSLQIPPAS
jgi:ubiquinone biosynthesis protein Coq4